MEASALERLRDEQNKVLENCKESIKQWALFKSDYVALKDRISTLPDKTSHDVMVPFGKFAFMPGRLIHTNEIMVLLGDNWFVERSAKQAVGIIDRRLVQVEETLKNLDEERENIEKQGQFTSDVMTERQNYIEIEEKLEDDELIKHQPKGRRGLSEEEKILERKRLQEKAKEISKRMAQEQETQRTQKSSADANDVKQQTTKKSVSWKDDLEEVQPIREHSEIEKGEVIYPVIRFSHSKPSETTKETTAEKAESASEEAKPVIDSPADIHLLLKSDIKSILKQSSSEDHFHPLPSSLPPPPLSETQPERKILPSSPEVFPGVVIERMPDQSSSEAAPQEQPKRISKFKQSRMH